MTNASLQQFRDNLMVAAKGPDPSAAMKIVCDTMGEVGNLKVLCDCRTKAPTGLCVGMCMQESVTAMGVSIYVHAPAPLVFAHPNALGPQWQVTSYK